jgi:4-amino-4-deoxy-L-arabinose transferase-like glycosyltransferase
LLRLDYEQVGPVGFLWLHKAMHDFVSGSEWGLRLPTMLAGVAIPLLLWSVMKRLTGVNVAAVAVVL